MPRYAAVDVGDFLGMSPSAMLKMAARARCSYFAISWIVPRAASLPTAQDCVAANQEHAAIAAHLNAAEVCTHAGDETPTGAVPMKDMVTRGRPHVVARAAAKA
jgi:hypothetical protein